MIKYIIYFRPNHYTSTDVNLGPPLFFDKHIMLLISSRIDLCINMVLMRSKIELN